MPSSREPSSVVKRSDNIDHTGDFFNHSHEFTDQKVKPLVQEPTFGFVLKAILLAVAIGGTPIAIIKLIDSPVKNGATAAATTPSENDSQVRTLAYPGGGDVIVFLSKKAHSDGMALINSKASPALLLPYIACLVPSGTKGVRLDVSWGGLSEVVVTSGSNAGCRGWVPTEVANK